ncbi:MAG: hypothetical protein ACYSVY_14805, partial [Planctomycetota bacterium]
MALLGAVVTVRRVDRLSAMMTGGFAAARALTFVLITQSMPVPASGASRPAAIERVELPHGYFWLATPAQIEPQTRYPLIVCLHGTETRAADILEFWLSLEAELPFIFVAPQGIEAGWRETDLTLITEVRSHIEQAVNYDPRRVLLTGHSAGGAMAFHLLYVEDYPATAVAVTANYVPPTVTADLVKQRRDVPLFYAVGEADVNRPRMRDGLHLLRGAGANVTVQRPRIGHVLSPRIGQAALDWFGSVCRDTTQRTLDDARADLEEERLPGPAAAALERILGQRRSHFAQQVAEATDLLEQLQRPGRVTLARAQLLAERVDFLAARDALMEVERHYNPSSLAAEAKQRRQNIESMPRVVQMLATIQRETQEREAAALWQAAMRALAQARLTDAQRNCRNILALYPASSV